MCNFPDIQYTNKFEPLSGNILPEGPRTMFNLICSKGFLNNNYLIDNGIINMTKLEEVIVNKIKNCKENIYASNNQLLEIFCLIQIWGGMSGRNIFVMGDGLKWEKIAGAYKQLVVSCINTPVPGPNENPLVIAKNSIENINKAIEAFYYDENVHNISTSFITKHTRFWLCMNIPNNPLPIYDSTFANRLMGRAGVYLRNLKQYWNCMIDKAEEKGVSLLALERQLFIYYQNHPQ